ncbi:MAG: hypothetical protein ACO1SV_12210 [Fimbriimonas sp.]
MTYLQSISAAFGSELSGLIGDVGYRVVDQAGTVRIARTADGITEQVDFYGDANTGIYLAYVTLDTAWGQVRIVWDVEGVPAAAAVGTVDTRLPLVAAYAARIGSAAVAVGSPVTASGTNIVRKAAYLEEAGDRALRWEVSGIDLTGAVVTLVDRQHGDDPIAVATCEDAGDPVQHVVVELDEETTAALPVGPRYMFLTATYEAGPAHVAQVLVTVL